MAKRHALRHFKIKYFAQLLGIDHCHALGIMEALWYIAMEHAPNGLIGKLSDPFIASEIGHSGDPTVLIGALIRAELLEQTDQGVAIHDWHEHADDGLHMKLARKGERFWSGQIPKIGRLPKAEQVTVGELYKVPSVGLPVVDNSYNTRDSAVDTAALQRTSGIGIHPYYRQAGVATPDLRTDLHADPRTSGGVPSLPFPSLPYQYLNQNPAEQSTVLDQEGSHPPGPPTSTVPNPTPVPGPTGVFSNSLPEGPDRTGPEPQGESDRSTAAFGPQSEPAPNPAPEPNPNGEGRALEPEPPDVAARLAARKRGNAGLDRLSTAELRKLGADGDDIALAEWNRRIKGEKRIETEDAPERFASHQADPVLDADPEPDPPPDERDDEPEDDPRNGAPEPDEIAEMLDGVAAKMAMPSNGKPEPEHDYAAMSHHKLKALALGQSDEGAIAEWRRRDAAAKEAEAGC